MIDQEIQILKHVTDGPSGVLAVVSVRRTEDGSVLLSQVNDAFLKMRPEFEQIPYHYRTR